MSANEQLIDEDEKELTIEELHLELQEAKKDMRCIGCAVVILYAIMIIGSLIAYGTSHFN